MSGAVGTVEGLRRFRPYSSYKESGVDWLGDIPTHWTHKVLKRRFRVENGATPKTSEPDFWNGEIVWVTPDDLGDLVTPVLSNSSRHITDEGHRNCGTTIVPAGSLVLSTRAPIGHLAIAGVELCTNQGCRSLVFRSRSDGRYSYYQLHAARPELESWGQGSTFKELSRSKLEALPLVDPPPDEQQAIAEFLDRKTGKIDALVAKKERLIELLQEKRTALITHAVTKGLDPTAPTKTSGIAWLGDIPAHWDVVKVTYRYQVQLGKMLDQSRITGQNLFPYLRVYDVQWGEINVCHLPTMDFTPREQDKFRLRAGDLLVNEGGSYVGRSTIWKGQLQDCFYQKALHRVRARSGRDTTRFFYYVMLFVTKQGVFVAGGNQTTIDHLTAEQLNGYRLAFPLLAEQMEIADYLDDRDARLGRLIARVEDAVVRLKEFRTALISAAVTGKIDVREEVE